jgi:hypothetical protein
MDVSDQLHASVALLPRKESENAQCIGGRVGSRAGLDYTGDIKIDFPYQESNVDSSMMQVAVQSLYKLNNPAS